MQFIRHAGPLAAVFLHVLRGYPGRYVRGNRKRRSYVASVLVDHCIGHDERFENTPMHHDQLNHFHHTLVTR